MTVQDTEVFGLSPRFGRNNAFEMKESVEQRTQKDVCKDELRQQVTISLMISGN